MTDYTDLATLRAYIGMNTADTSRDALLSSTITTASAMIDRHTGRVFGKDTVASARIFRLPGRVLDEMDSQVLLVDDIASTTGLVVETGDITGTSWAAVTGSEVYPDNALARGYPITGVRIITPGWIWTAPVHGRVRVTALWGWPAVPHEVTQATLIQAARLFKRKDSPEGILGDANWGAMRLSRIDPDVNALIQHLLLPGFA